MTEKGTIAYVAELPMCNFCQTREAAYDAKTKQGPWGYMCQQCFEKHGVGLGLGQGQILKLKSAASKPFLDCVASAEGTFDQKVKTCSLKTATMSQEDLESAVMDGLWYPTCPYCGASTSAEPDAEETYCDACDQRFKIINPYF